jgi:hypothetical protein
MTMTPTPLAVSGKPAQFPASGAASGKPDARRGHGSVARHGKNTRRASRRLTKKRLRNQRIELRLAQWRTEENPMRAQTDYTRLAEKIDYPALEKKLAQLRDQEPPKKHKRASDVLTPVRDKLVELRAKGWTCAQLVEELKSAGLPVGQGTLRRYLNGGQAAKSKSKRRAHRREAVGG